MISFVKAHADGNDFLIVAEQFTAADRARVAKALCDRNFGIGADGVEWVAHEQDRLRITLTNADGSYAEISGNGTRCVAAWWAMENAGEQVNIVTGSGARRCDIVGRFEHGAEVRTTMGVPSWREMAVALDGQTFAGVQVLTGNPHFVLIGETIPLDWKQTGAALANHASFPDGANIEFVRVLGREEIEFRIYERGAGPTLSSGTGSTASAVAAMARGLASRAVTVRSEGGMQRVEWSDNSAEALLTGKATIVARGEAFL